MFNNFKKEITENKLEHNHECSAFGDQQKTFQFQVNFILLLIYNFKIKQNKILYSGAILCIKINRLKYNKKKNIMTKITTKVKVDDTISFNNKQFIQFY